MTDSRVHLFVASGSLPMSFLRLDDWQEPFPRHWHEEWGFAVIKQGINRFWFRGAWYNAGPGSVVIVPPGEIHDGGLSTDEPWGEHMCYVPTATMARIVEGHSGIRQEPRFRGPILDDPNTARSLLALHRIFSGGAPVDPLEASEAKIRSLGALVARHGGTAAPQIRNVTPSAIRRALELLHDEPELPLTVDALAAKVGLSTSHFIRAFRSHAGLPPHAYRKQLRLARAQELLRGGLPLSDVAVRAGFSDQPHFTREFRRKLGLTPGAFVAAQRARQRRIC